MSDSIFGKEDIGYRKKRVAETSQGFAIPSIIRFAHKFVGGETSFSLLNLSAPAEMSGFMNPSPSVMAGAGIATNSSALRLYISSGGRMVEFDSYKCLGTTIQFLGALSAGIPQNTVIFGEIASVAASPIVVGDGRFIRKSYSLALATTSLSLGFTYKVGVNLGSSDQIGDIKVYRNGVLQMRNVGNATAGVSADGNFQEIDAGNGYGTLIVFNTPPVGQADAIMVEMGYQIASGQLQIWSELERLQGGLLAIAQDAALGFGQPLSNYLSTNATELDRRAFGDSVTSALSSVSSLNTSVGAINSPPQTLSGNGYTTLPGGLILQWGTASVGAGSGSTAAVVFSKTLAVPPFSIACTFNTSAVGGTSTIYVYNGSTTGFNVARGNSSNLDGFTAFSWMAIGRI